MIGRSGNRIEQSRHFSGLACLVRAVRTNLVSACFRDKVLRTNRFHLEPSARRTLFSGTGVHLGTVSSIAVRALKHFRAVRPPFWPFSFLRQTTSRRQVSGIRWAACVGLYLLTRRCCRRFTAVDQNAVTGTVFRPPVVVAHLHVFWNCIFCFSCHRAFSPFWVEVSADLVIIPH